MAFHFSAHHLGGVIQDRSTQIHLLSVSRTSTAPTSLPSKRRLPPAPISRRTSPECNVLLLLRICESPPSIIFTRRAFSLLFSIENSWISRLLNIQTFENTAPSIIGFTHREPVLESGEFTQGGPCECQPKRPFKCLNDNFGTHCASCRRKELWGYSMPGRQHVDDGLDPITICIHLSHHENLFWW
ncbi:hypothetical protein AVEN_106562-1 [Araneus ventricosus]|uniref:Uncharacterized protein n=1 Tax=Araneus ventricosus TaxID=182803 RepID=A0A4Y2SGX6_ARAVE|nr:hypothetical protein AVEN_106562-1 [Araneus ventricosus]